MSTDRLIHLIAGLITLALLRKIILKQQTDDQSLSVVIFTCLGTWVPDWDLFFGIGYHRSPLTHSALPAVLSLILSMKYKLDHSITTGLSIGIASHLLWDIVDYGNVHWITGGDNDRMFLLANAILLLILSITLPRFTRRIIK